MKPKKQSRISKKDIKYQEQIEQRVKDEKVKLEHPHGAERFKRLVKLASRKKKDSL